ncbi:MAG: TetR/AcrR family transcriptional regulator [Phenylobacterium sp.]|nr:TetR/AcrR family transcriptional regulator [Phenylobacterium sp.]
MSPADTPPPSADSANVRRQPRQKRAIESRQRILDGARRLLGADGVKGFTMRAVARESGVGLGTLYEYFPSRESIMAWLLEERIAGRLAILDRHLAHLSPDEDIAQAIAAYDADMARERMWSRMDVVLFGTEHREGPLEALRRDFHRQLEARYLALCRSRGSKWSQAGLEALARYMVEIDILNIQLQLDAEPNQRAIYRDMTYATFIRFFERTLQPEPGGAR